MELLLENFIYDPCVSIGRPHLIVKVKSQIISSPLVIISNGILEQMFSGIKSNAGNVNLACKF